MVVRLFFVQRKAYSRDFMDMIRVRVKLKESDGTLVRQDIPNRRALLIRLAAEIKTQEQRVNPPPAKTSKTSNATSTSASNKNKNNKKNNQNKKGGKKK